MLSANYNAREIKEQVSPVDFLARLGHHPAYRSGKELFYLSMLRDEKTASFCVDEMLGVWYDHGGSNRSGIKGGNVIDLALAYWYPLSFREALEKISQVCSVEPEKAQSFPSENYRPRKANKIPHYRISEIKELGNNASITSYLQMRGIWPVAHDLVKEIYYYVENEKKNRNHFFSAGWMNENGGWEVNNPYFKGCLGAKGMTIVPGDPHRLTVFESLTDYLSWKYEQEDHSQTVFVLNGVTFVEAAIKRAASYGDITVYFDNDKAGIEATQTFLQAFPYAEDGAHLYQGHKDYNKHLMTELDALCRIIPQGSAGIFDRVKVGFSR